MYQIQTVAVVGAGTMGCSLAALLAGSGCDVYLFDVIPTEIIATKLAQLEKSSPPALFAPTDLTRITPASLDTDFANLAQADWVLEAIVEDLAVKQAFYAKLDALCAQLDKYPIITSNTSGLPLHDIAAGRSLRFQNQFLGTHFFNPPRYLRLLELIPIAQTDLGLIQFMTQFTQDHLGKGVVLCRDTPNFIANRIGIALGSFDLTYALQNGYDIAEVDAIAGPALLRPKTAVFRLLDLVGIDVLAHVAQNAARLLPDDPDAAPTTRPAASLIQAMVAKGWLGNKSGCGFYKTVTNPANGKKEFWVLDLHTMVHQPPAVISLPVLDGLRKVKGGKIAQLQTLINSTDRAGQFAWHSLAFELSYAARCVPAVTTDLSAIDNALKWGFSHELGPFEIWDALGVASVVARMQSDGYPVPAWVQEMLAKQGTHFYQWHADGLAIYQPTTGVWTVAPQNTPSLTIAKLQAQNRVIVSNTEAALYDLGDRVLLCEFHGKANTIGTGVSDLLTTALQLLATADWQGMVIGNQGAWFSAGANLDLNKIMVSGRPPLVVLQELVERNQAIFQQLKYCSKPVVAAPFDRTLGGGTEISLAADRIVAHIELYMGLVETGVGLVPGWGGCKELLCRMLNPVMRVPNADPLPHLQKIFETIALAKVSGSAKDAYSLGFLTAADRIVFDRATLLDAAKAEVLHLWRAGYHPPTAEPIYAAGQAAKTALLAGIQTMRAGGYISAHDQFIAEHLAHVLCGGDLSEPTWVSQSYILQLEKQAFLNLVQTEATMARIMHTLQTGKPLRN
jgi:3-hydroxyacyl-CoA dehydrogenase